MLRSSASACSTSSRVRPVDAHPDRERGRRPAPAPGRRPISRTTAAGSREPLAEQPLRVRTRDGEVGHPAAAPSTARGPANTRPSSVTSAGSSCTPCRGGGRGGIARARRARSPSRPPSAPRAGAARTPRRRSARCRARSGRAPPANAWRIAASENATARPVCFANVAASIASSVSNGHGSGQRERRQSPARRRRRPTAPRSASSVRAPPGSPARQDRLPHRHRAQDVRDALAGQPAPGRADVVQEDGDFTHRPIMIAAHVIRRRRRRARRPRLGAVQLRDRHPGEGGARGARSSSGCACRCSAGCCGGRAGCSASALGLTGVPAADGRELLWAPLTAVQPADAAGLLVLLFLGARMLHEPRRDGARWSRSSRSSSASSCSRSPPRSGRSRRSTARDVLLPMLAVGVGRPRPARVPALDRARARWPS